MKDVLEIGQIVNTKGLKGEIKINSFLENKHRFEKLSTILIKNKDEFIEYEIQKVAYSKNQVVLKLKGIDNIDCAERLKSLYVYVKKENLEKLPAGVYYIADLIGIKVYTELGEYLGRVDDILKNPKANDVYVIKNDAGVLRYLPSIPEVLKKIDLPNEKIIVHLLEGL